MPPCICSRRSNLQDRRTSRAVLSLEAGTAVKVAQYEVGSRTGGGTTRWAWSLGGVWQCLIDGKVDEARARCALAVAAADQRAIDGSWLIAQTSLLENPYQHRPPTATELHHSALLDSRWVEVYLSHVKDLDTYQEAKKRLSNKQVSSGDAESKGGGKGAPPRAPKSRRKRKGLGRAATPPAKTSKVYIIRESAFGRSRPPFAFSGHSRSTCVFLLEFLEPGLPPSAG